MSLIAARNLVALKCAVMGITVEDLMSGRRTRTIASARREIALTLRESTSLSWAEIGSVVGLKGSPRAKDFQRKGGSYPRS